MDRDSNVLQLSDSDTFKLKTPIMVGGEKTDTLTLTDPTLGQLKGIKLPTGGNFDLAELPRMVAVVANIPPSSAEQIRVTDLVGLFSRVMDFFEISDDTES